jgi:hypothetical protein
LSAIPTASGDLAIGFDRFLERSDPDEVVNVKVRILNDSRGADYRVIFDGRIPPAVEMEDMVGGGQVQPCPNGLEERTKKRG